MAFAVLVVSLVDDDFSLPKDFFSIDTECKLSRRVFSLEDRARIVSLQADRDSLRNPQRIAFLNPTAC